MIHFALIDDSFPINTRNRKILDSLVRHYGNEARISVLTWDRNHSYTEEQDGFYVYQKDSAYGNKTRKLMNLWGYRRFCHKAIRSLHPDVVIASHWNNLMMVPRLNHSCQVLIYENLDVPTEAYLLRKATTAIEHWYMQRVDLTIHASRFFTKLYSPNIPQIVLENKPVSPISVLKTESISLPIRIAFIGLLRYRDILENLIDAIRNDSRFHLYFHGEGHAKEYLEACAMGARNIFFTGRYDYDNIAQLYQQTDIVWAAYPNKDFNVKYAISNKFHESLSFSTPAVYANNTYLGDYVVQNHIGMAVDPYSVEAIKALLEHIYTNREQLRQMSHDMWEYNKGQTTWDEDFMSVISAINNRLCEKKKR